MKPVIIGFDPGLTSAFAVVSLNGDILKLKSDRELTFPTIKEEVIKLGRPVLLAIDKASTGTSAEKLASSLGCNIWKPESDMLVDDKDDITSEKNVSNDHERDALASALVVYNQYEILFRKIDSILNTRDLLSFSDDVKAMIIEKKVSSIDEAIDKILDVEVQEELQKKEPDRKIDWEGLAKGLRRKVKENQRRYDILKIYTEKLEEKLKLLEKQKKTYMDEEREKNMEARTEVMKVKEIKAKDILIKQLQFELNKQRNIKMAYERKVGREDEVKLLEEEGCVPVIPVNNFDADEITNANLEYGLTDQVVWFKDIKPSKRAARALIACGPRIVIADFNNEIREMLENADIIIVTDIDVKMTDYYAAVSEDDLEFALKDNERVNFLDWLVDYKNKFIS
ncbi:MAG: DUF460 domain-containing protein [Candidatus Aenigmarchaeota archaeon]|nr:DUF460 domain-containing protein [Candidatus Aenigmarchaeota archaeon]